VNLAPLLEAPLPVIVHVATVVPAFFLGLWQLAFSTRGSRGHRVVGTAYLVLMSVTAVTSVFVHASGLPHLTVGPLRFSWIHLFVPLTLSGVTRSTIAVRRHDVEGHRRSMIATFAGALLIAGLFAFTPGRLMYRMFFG
jgi:uncharacterized membrane protein